MNDLKIAVVGAGVVGLTTALELQKTFNNAQVDIIANEFYEYTTSYVAAGIFRPSSTFNGPTPEITKQWINNSYKYWEQIKNRSESSRAGVTEVSGYIFSKDFPNIVRNKYIEKIVPIYRPVTEEELRLCPGEWKYGSFFTTLLTECSSFLPWATQKFVEAGGIIDRLKIDRFSTLSSKYKIIVNCCGLGAKDLCDDNKLVPIRGQVLKVHAPWIKTFFYGDFDTYIIPGIDGVTLGGCRQYESYKRNVDKYDSLSIKERCESLVPSLRGAVIKKELVGLRPHRDPVRVEKEIIYSSYSKLRLVHNYGHGGYGVTTAPGTAIYACQLAKEIYLGNSKL